MADLQSIAVRIIKEQELVIGPLAWSEARKVPGLRVDGSETANILSNVDEKEVIDMLVARYERLFGRASHEVCREAASSLLTGIPRDEIPVSLR